MFMGNNFSANEQGGVEVEAVFILPITIISVVMLIFMSLFIYQRANLQASLETALIYYKNYLTDNYITYRDTAAPIGEESPYVLNGDNYKADELRSLIDFSKTFGDAYNTSSEETQKKFREFFFSVGGNMLFYNPDDFKIKLSYHNGFMTDVIYADVKQKVKFPVDFSLLGVGEEYYIYSSAKVDVLDSDTIVRNVDFAVDVLVYDTGLYSIIKDVGSKISEAYGKFKDFLHID